MPHFGEIVLPENVGHHFRRQFLPDLITRFGIPRIVKQIRRGNFIHRPAHFQRDELVILAHYLSFQMDKAVGMRACAKGQDSEKQRDNDTFNALHELSTEKIDTATSKDAGFGESVLRIPLNEK